MNGCVDMVVLLHPLHKVQLKPSSVGNPKGGGSEKELRKESSWRGSVELSNISSKADLVRLGLYKRGGSPSLKLLSLFLPFCFFFFLISPPSILPSPHGGSKYMTVRQCPASPSGRVIILCGLKSLPPLARQTCHTQREKETEKAG